MISENYGLIKRSDIDDIINNLQIVASKISAVEINADTINLNTDELESKLDTLISVENNSSGSQQGTTDIINAINAESNTLHTDLTAINDNDFSTEATGLIIKSNTANIGTPLQDSKILNAIPQETTTFEPQISINKDNVGLAKSTDITSLKSDLTDRIGTLTNPSVDTVLGKLATLVTNLSNNTSVLSSKLDTLITEATNIDQHTFVYTTFQGNVIDVTTTVDTIDLGETFHYASLANTGKKDLWVSFDNTHFFRIVSGGTRDLNNISINYIYCKTDSGSTELDYLVGK